MSALTSLLVRDDVISVRQIEDALQRQVLEGGELDSALLEACSVSENVLIAYRAASVRALAASREDVMSASATSRILLASKHAQSYQVTPISHDATTLIVACANPLTASQLTALADKTGLRVEWRITCEARVQAALARFYDVRLSARFRALVDRLDALDPGELPAVEPLQATPAAALSAELLEGFDESEDFESALEAAFERVSALPLAAAALAASDSAKAASSAAPGGRKSATNGAPAGASIDAPEYRASRDPVPRVTASPFADTAPPEPQDDGTSRRRRTAPLRIPQGPLSATVAAQALEQAEERDSVVEIFFRFARQYFDTSVLLSVRDERVLGLAAHNAPELPDVHTVSVSIARGSSLDDLVRSLLPRVIDLSRKEEDHALLQALRRKHAQPGALFPICVKRRVVAIVYGDRSGDALQLDELSPLLGLLPHAARAFERIIRLRKALGSQSTRVPPQEKAREREFQHAATQLHFELPPKPSLAARVEAPPVVVEASASDVAGSARTRKALDSLGVPRSPPPPPAARSALPKAAEETARFGSAASELPSEEDREPTQRMTIEPLPLAPVERVSNASPGYFSKPPPGTGRYSSLATQQREALTQSEALDQAPNNFVDETDTQRVRRRKSSGPPRASRPPAAATPSARPPQPGTRSAPARASKPPPGAGSYHSHGLTTELISLPPGRKLLESTPDSTRRGRSKPPGAPSPDAISGGHARDAVSAHGHAARSEPAVAAAWAQTHQREMLQATHATDWSPTNTTHDPQRAAELPVQPIVNETRMRTEMLLRELRNLRVDQQTTIVADLVVLGDDALALLVAEFPGPLWYDRRRTHTPPPLGREIGPFCRALDAFGNKALRDFAPLLRSEQVETRYYATLFVSDRVHEALLEPLIERLFDDDAQIRLLVRDSLPHYRRLSGFARISERLREQAQAANAPMKTRLAAIDALAVLRDAGSVPILIELITDKDKQISVPAYRALVSITCQDFGKVLKKWRAWYHDNAQRHRVEWLIDGLMHGEQTLRAAAGQELQKITRVYYGYVAASPKRERELAQKRYWDWWSIEGRKKFG
jgi:hypothetical protein